MEKSAIKAGQSNFEERALASARIRSTEDCMARARHAYGVASFVDAEYECRNALSAMPDHADALYVLAFSLMGQGRVEEAEQLMRRVVKANIRQSWAYAHHAQMLISLGRFSEALSQADRGLRVKSQCALSLINRANALLGLARYEECSRAYERVLERAPSSAEAWTNHGKALMALGRPRDALNCLDRSLEFDARSFATYVNRGNALNELGQHAAAVQSYDRALEIQPRAVAVWCCRGRALQDLGQDVTALQSYDAALSLEPESFDALFQSSVTLERLQRYDEAVARCNRALQQRDTDKRVWLGRGNALHGIGKDEDALLAYDTALLIDSGYVDALSNRGAVLQNLRRYSEAIEHYDQALAMAPKRADLWGARGNVLQQMGLHSASILNYTEAISVEPDSAPAWFHRATALQNLNRHEDALAAFERVLDMQAAYSEARIARALCLLLLGYFERGWAAFESRWDAPAVARTMRIFKQPLWLGEESPEGKTVLLHAEQGFGDTLQFCRYASLLDALGATVILEVQGPLTGLLSTLHGVSRVIERGQPLPVFNLHCPLMSMPLATRTGPSGLADDIPYLRADEHLTEIWRERIAALTRADRPRIGLAWSGNSEHANDHNRSLSLETLSKLFEIDAHFISLQEDVRETDLPALSRSGVVHLGQALRDFSDTAAVIDSLDLVISVDTSVAHLAGALGKPVWILLPSFPDWRWLLDAEDTPWYPTVRLFRQPSAGDWLSVVKQIATLLRMRHSNG